MSTQDDVVSAFETIITSSADLIKTDLLSYHQSLGTILFEVAGLDSAHKLQVQALPKESLIALRYHIQSLTVAIQNALQAGSF